MLRSGAIQKINPFVHKCNISFVYNKNCQIRVSHQVFRLHANVPKLGAKIDLSADVRISCDVFENGTASKMSKQVNGDGH